MSVDKSFTHALIIGGTGMLRGVVRALATEAKAVSLLARSGRRLKAVTEAEERVHPVAADWCDGAAVRRGLRQTIDQHGPVDLVVCWMHSTAEEGPMGVADMVGSSDEPPRFFQIYGSGTDAAGGVKTEWHESLSRRGNIQYRRIILGREGRRWLTDEEICAGVLRAVRGDEADVVVGEV